MDSQEHKMTSYEWQLFNHQKKIDKFWERQRHYCYCGHSVAILPKEERTFCTHCGHWVYKDIRKQRKNIQRIKMEEFRNKVKEALRNAL